MIKGSIRKVILLVAAIASVAAAYRLWPPTPSTTAEEEMALIKAAQDGDLESSRRLLDKGVDPNCRFITYQGKHAAPLIYACKMGRTDVGELLVQRGANVNNRTTVTQERPEKSEYSDWDVVTLKTLESPTALIEAVSKSNTRLVKLLLEKGADVNARSSRRTFLEKKGGYAETREKVTTALIQAIVIRNTNLAKLLLEKGANPNRKGSIRRAGHSSSSESNLEFTPLYAALTRLPDAVEYFGQEVRECSDADIHLLRLLIEKGAAVKGICATVSEFQSGGERRTDILPLEPVTGPNCKEIRDELIAGGAL
jgi:ankyrin repeat protein